MLNLWKFRYYGIANEGEISPSSDVRDTYLDGSKRLRAHFFSRMRMLAGLPLEEWNELLYKNLAGECRGLGEIRFKADNVQQRPLGFISGDLEFTIVFWATEKGDKWVPRSACEKALRRKSEILEDRRTSHALWLSLE